MNSTFDPKHAFAQMSKTMNHAFKGMGNDAQTKNTDSWDDTDSSFKTRARSALTTAKGRLESLTHNADDTPPPEMPDFSAVFDQARQSSMKVGRITAGMYASREVVMMYRDVERGHPITGRKVWDAFRRVTKGSSTAASATWRRHVAIAGVDAVARVVAWKTAEKAKTDLIAKVLHNISKNLAGRATFAFMAVSTFKVMSRDLKRFRAGELTDEDFYRNCALTGVSLAAPLAGSAVGGPVGTTAGIAVSIGAGMLRR